VQGAAPSEMLLDVALAKGAEDGVGGEGGEGGGGVAGDVSLETKLSMDEEEEDYDLLLANTGVGGASKPPPRVLRFVDFYVHIQNCKLLRINNVNILGIQGPPLGTQELSIIIICIE
jgi:hypothetical protein